MFLTDERNSSKHHNNQKQQPRNSAGHTHVIGLERIVVDQQRNQCGRTQGAALSNDKRAVKFLKLVAQLSDEIIKNNRCDERYGNAYKLPPLSRPVNRGRLIKIF